VESREFFVSALSGMSSNWVKLVARGGHYSNNLKDRAIGRSRRQVSVAFPPDMREATLAARPMELKARRVAQYDKRPMW
jgi:hypothetical protein